MLDSASVDDLAAILWRTEAEDAGAPASIAEGRTRTAFDGQSDELKKRWRKFSRAALSARLSTVAPAEVGGRADAQTEARAIAQRLQDVIEGHSWRLNIDKATDIIATALAAKDAELIEQTQAWEHQWLQERDLKIAAVEADRRTEAQLAEANKALDRIIDIHVRNYGRQDEKIADILPIARRAREQGGENV